MYDQAAALKDVFACIDRVNEQLPPSDRIGKSGTTVLAGPGSALESLTLVTLMIEIEEAVQAASGKRLSVLEGALMHEDGARFSTAAELAQWIADQT
jgi:hypothetical protein